MTEALKDMPEWTAGSGLKSKIAHGVPLTQKDIALEGTPGKGKFIKIIDADRELLAVITQHETPGEYRYCCVFN
jgi:hypothetical protein